jgi:PAS domain S-box-containing protein
MSNYRKELESEVTRRTEELKHTFLFQQRLIDALPVPVFYKDSEGRYLGCNSSFEKFFGQKREQVTGKSVYELSPKEFADLYHEKDLALLQNPGIQIYESTVKDTGGVVHDVIFHKATFPNMDGSVGGLIGAILDITDRKQVVERIRKALGATIRAIAVTVETRDPYTAGHQRRVADLARAIATEMNLSVDQIDGIRMAAAIHDLGKISVPSEILSKPTKLTNIEFSLIKTHSQSGYDILKDIDFPWPVARTVLEHHERMNGSGYPNGLTGDNILLESRILSVADVVESIASHRPYRSALGIDAALNEISKNKGILYDPEVSDACLRLFHEKDYKIID